MKLPCELERGSVSLIYRNLQASRAACGPSPAGRSASKTRVDALITRGSIILRKNLLAKRMDCRVKPGNDRGGSGARSALAQALLLVPQQRREQVVEDGARAGLDFDRHGHPRREIYHLVLDFHLGAVERYARSVNELVRLGIGVAFRALRVAAAGFVL